MIRQEIKFPTSHRKLVTVFLTFQNEFFGESSTQTCMHYACSKAIEVVGRMCLKSMSKRLAVRTFLYIAADINKFR